MRILSISLDRSILESTSRAARRQVLAYAGLEAVVVVVTPGIAKDVELAPGIRARTFGGASKFGAMMQVWSALRRFDAADVVTAQEPVYTGVLAFSIARRLGCGLHLQDHSAMFGRKAFGWREKLLLPIAIYILRHADRIRTVSERGKRGLIEIGIPQERIDVIPIATDLERFSSVDRARAIPGRILCISRLEKEKGVNILLDAFAVLRRTHPETTLTILGGGSQRAALEAQARRLGISDAVSFAGNVEDVLSNLSHASIYVQPSYYEGWGLAVIEAAAAGVPIVMTDVGCAGEVFKNEESALIVPPADAKALADALDRMYTDETLRRSLVEAARQAISSLKDPETSARDIFVSIERALKVRR